MAEGEMAVTARYDLALSDMVWSNLWAISRFRVLKLVAAVMVIGLFAWVSRVASGEQSANPGFRFFIIAGIALAVPLATYWGTVQSFRKLKPEQLRKEFRFSPGGLSVGDGLSRGDISWQAIPKVVETNRALHIFLQDQVYHLVPRRAFASAADLAAARQILTAALGARAQLKREPS